MHRYTFAVNRRQISLFTVVIPVLLLATVVRFSALDERALWFDEGVSLTFGQMSLPDVLHYHILWQDTNPPVYRVLLGIWTGAVGTTAFTARAFSALLGVVAIPLAYCIGRYLRLPRSVCLVAALLLALWPMQVYYSREVKHYTFVQLFLLLALWVWLRLFPIVKPIRLLPRRRQLLLAAASALFTTMAVGAHYMALLMIPVLAGWTVVWVVVMRRTHPVKQLLHPTLLWIAAQLAAGLTLLPWVLATASGAAAGTRSAAENVGLESQTPINYLLGMFLEFASGPVGSPVLRATAVTVVFGFAVFAFARRSFRSWKTGGALLSLIMLPVMLGLGVQFVMPFFYPRFLMFVTPALALIVAQGIETIGAVAGNRKRLAALLSGIGIFTVIAGLLIGAQLGLPQPVPDLRPVAADLDRHLGPNDALVYSYSWQPGMLAAYLPDARQPTYYPSFFDEGEVGNALDAIMQKHGRVWLLTYTIGADNPINDVGLYLLAHAATPGGVWYGESQLTLFLSPEHASNAEHGDICSSFDSGRITLCASPIDAAVPPGQPLVTMLRWQANEQLAERFVVFVHLLAKNNPIPVAQQDIQPVNGLKPTFTWTPGQWVEDLHAVTPPDLEGAYQIYVGLYDADTLERVPVDGGGDSVYLGDVTVMQP